MMETSFFVSRETLIATPTPGMAMRRETLYVSMSKNSTKASEFFHVPTNRVVELGTQVELERAISERAISDTCRR
jgi:KUP system potassium uptake protein